MPKRQNNKPKKINQNNRKEINKFVKALFFISGRIYLILGIIGIILPISHYLN